MRWILILLLLSNGIYFAWQSVQQQNHEGVQAQESARIASNSDKLVLLAESINIEARGNELQSMNETPTHSEGAKAESGSPMCWFIGPFREQITGKQIVGRLESLDIHLKLVDVSVTGSPDYWVHIAPQVSRKAAIKLLRSLQGSKVDSFLITEGELENGISLGFFTREELAEAVLKERVEQGYSAQIKIVPRSHSEMWAVFSAGEYGKLSDTLWEKIKEGSPSLERRKNYCDTIASTENFY